MSLDFNLTNVKDQTATRDKDGNLTGLAQSVIFVCMFVDMQGPTKENLEEFMRRTRLYETGLGALRVKDGEPVYLTQKEVALLIGLTTNVPTRTARQFDTKMKNILWDRLVRKVNAANA